MTRFFWGSVLSARLSFAQIATKIATKPAPFAALVRIARTSPVRRGGRAKIRGHRDSEVCGGDRPRSWSVLLGRWGLSGDAVVDRSAFQAAATAIWCLWSFSRLWGAGVSRA